MSDSRLMARQRLTAVLSEQKERAAAEHTAAEHAKQTQLAHILSLKLSLQHTHALHQSQHAAAAQARQHRSRQQRTERRQLEAAGLNADGVFMARDEAERRDKEAQRRRRADVEARRRIEANIAREEEERRERERREEEQRAVKEKLRMKVSRNLIEITALQLAQHEQRAKRKAERFAQRLARQQQESKETLLPALTADDADEESEEAEGAAVQTPHSRFQEWQQRHSPSHAVTSTELLHYQRLQHSQKLTTALTGMRDRHMRHEREAIMGRQYHNAPLLSEPSLLHFIDYVPGTTVTLPLTITNTSFSFNTIQPQPQPPQSPLSLSYTPPGRLSSGQSFTLTTTYHSTAPTDDAGTIQLIAESGPFHVPWKASRRRAAVAMDQAELVLECVRGDKTRRQWHMRNDGAVAVRWSVQVVSVEGKWREDDEDELAGVDADSDDVGKVMGRKGFPFRMALEGELQGYSKQQVSVLFQPIIPATLTVDCVVTFSPMTADISSTGESVATEPSTSASASLIPSSGPTPSDPASSPSTTDPTSPSSTLPTSSSSASSPASTAATTSFPLRLTGRSHDLPIHLTDTTLLFGTILSGRLYRTALHLTNRSTAPHRYALHCPASLRSVLSFVPATGVVQGEGVAVVGVRLVVGSGEEERVWKEAWRLARGVDSDALGGGEAMESERKKMAIDVPLTVEVSGQTLPLHWNLRARLTSSILSLSATSLTFPPTLIGQASALPLTLTNHSPLLQTLHLSVPAGFSASFTSTFNPPSPAHPTHTFIHLLPLRSFTTTVLFAPTAPAPYAGRLALRSDAGDAYGVAVAGAGLDGGVVVEGGGEARLGAVVDGDSECVGLALRNEAGEEVEVEVWIPEGAVRGERSESSFLSVQPRVFRLAARERRRVLMTFAPDIAAQAAEEKAALSRLSVVAEEAEGSLASARSRKATEPGRKESAAQPEPKKKPKKLTADEQKRADEEAHQAEQQRLAHEAEQQQRKLDEERRREAERLYNSPEARHQRELEHPSNKLASDCACEWGVEEKGEAWSRHARHRVAIFYRSVKAVAAAQAAAEAKVEAGDDSKVAAAPTPAVPAVVEVVPRVTYLTLHTCIVQPTLLLEPAVLNFGRIAVGETSQRSVLVTNASDSPISITVDHFSFASPFRLLSVPASLAPSQSTTLTFAFEPSAARQTQSRIYVRTVATHSQLSLDGEAFLPSFTVSTTRLHTGHCQPGGTTSRQLTITNTSTNPLPLTLRLASHSPASLPCPFSIAAAAQPLLLPPGSAGLPVVVRFTGRAEGLYGCVLWVGERVQVGVVGSCGEWAVGLEVDSEGEAGVGGEGVVFGGCGAEWNVLRCVEESLTFDVRNRDNTAAASAGSAPDKPGKDKDAKDKAVKPAKGGKDSQAAATASATLVNESTYLPIKSTLYDTHCASPQPRTIILQPDDHTHTRYSRTVRLYMSTPTDSTAAATATASIDWSITQRDVMDNFFSIEPAGPAVLRAGEEGRGVFVFGRVRWDEWRRGKGVELLGHGLGGGEWVESEIKCVMKVGGGAGGKNEVPTAVRVEYFVVRVFVE